MPEVKTQDLVERLVALRRPGKKPSSQDRLRYAAIPRGELQHMISTLEQGLELAAANRKAPPRDKADRATLQVRKEKALVRIEALADRIAARKRLPALAQAQQVMATGMMMADVPPSSDPHFDVILHLAGRGKNKMPIEHALRLRHAIDEFDGPWRRTAADKFAHIIAAEHPGNFASLIELRMGDGKAYELLHKEILDRYLQFAMEKTSWGVLRLLDGEIRKATLKDKPLQQLLASPVLRSSVFEPMFLTDFSPRLTAAFATEALAKLHLFGSEFRATRVVSVGSGGKMVGRFLGGEMRLGSAARIHCDVHKRSWEKDLAAIDTHDRILIVTDIASSHAEMTRVREALAGTVPDTSVAIAALSGRIEAYEEMRSGPLAYFATLTAERDVELPWDRKGDYRRTSSSHFFGEIASRATRIAPLRIAKDFLETVTVGLRSLVS